ncbi:tripartite tricarboxylate transporter TctB family protein [Hoeflea prorocentri]|uniref:Tripartite tricarboxylate transporter TctB family protein n=1 Tax=Hoeflea prorocentri TaxID=1922333 RepID=A0A9X3UL65_9HYPH|nr:tripartite tricarboxylate transporter TctB family protein [Hoeflea prorocentri]MCY6382870.1 tripartite tricarboxylate transporter TctB family protein [Hoeflea prorocentri]MDA5400670.1 tripartite tricarboxylate transporter TctB family protein [Hoeflea prorocentri]
MSDVTKEIANIVFCGFLILLSVVLLSDLSTIRKSPFDFLASSSVPSILCWLVLALSAILMLRSAATLIRSNQPEHFLQREDHGRATQQDDDYSGEKSRLFQLLLVALASFLYVLTIVFSLVPYAISTSFVLFSCMAVLAPVGKRNWLLIFGLSIGVGGGCAFVFTELLPLPLPGF